VPGHLNDAAAACRTAADSVPIGAAQAAQEQLAAVGTNLGRAGEKLASAFTAVVEELSSEAHALVAALTLLRQEHLEAADKITSCGPPRSPSPAGATTPQRASHKNIRHPDGSEYPPDAGWAVPTLQPRVGTQDQNVTVGRIKIGSTEISGEFRSDQWDRWADDAGQRMADLNIRGPRYLRFHVEMRTVAMMIESRTREASVCINNRSNVPTDPSEAQNDAGQGDCR
jgi:hypothetical protein